MDKKVRFLVVDDEDGILRTLKHRLETKGFLVDAFSDPLECLKKFNPDAYDILIIDSRIPGMTGIRLLREIRKVDTKAKVVFLTAFEIHDKEWSLAIPDIRVDAFIKKPVAIDELVRQVTSII